MFFFNISIYYLRLFSVVESYRIDDDEFCMIRFYKVKQYDDPTPYSHEGTGKPRAYLKEKSIKVFGKCCWRIFT